MSADIVAFPRERCRPSRAEQREMSLHWLAAELAKAFPQMQGNPTEAAKLIDDRIERGMAARRTVAHLEEPPPR